ncbi:conserved hypothetical protein [Ricinus communis]|uniref:Uncharacterized protein n=1 Tax=Ricinus communis TaxID=3988 RepID=B9RPE7_RICCO|nr:conserved hypothetical protein [Ricinus communis]
MGRRVDLLPNYNNACWPTYPTMMVSSSVLENYVFDDAEALLETPKQKEERLGHEKERNLESRRGKVIIMSQRARRLRLSPEVGRCIMTRASSLRKRRRMKEQRKRKSRKNKSKTLIKALDQIVISVKTISEELVSALKGTSKMICFTDTELPLEGRKHN